MLSAVEQLEDSFCVFVLRFVGVAGEDLKVNGVLAHQSAAMSVSHASDI